MIKVATPNCSFGRVATILVAHECGLPRIGTPKLVFLSASNSSTGR
jgi:hypothetical protein